MGTIPHIAAATANHYKFCFFLFDQVPITARWTETAWNEKFAWHFYIWPAVTIEP